MSLYDLSQEGLINQPVDDELTRTALTLTYGVLASKWASVASTNLVFLSEADTGKLMIASMIVTAEPLHMVIYSDNASEGGHSVTAYAYDSSQARFRIYDSNFPNDEVTMGWNVLTGFGTYSKAAAYPSGFFDSIGYASDDTFGSPAQFKNIVTQWENGTLVDYFANLTATDKNGVSQALAYGQSVTVAISDQANQTVTGVFTRPAGSTLPVYLHVFVDGARQPAQSATIDASGNYTVSFATQLTQKAEVMLIVSEHHSDLFHGFSAFGVFTVDPGATHFFQNFGFEKGDLSFWTAATTLRSNGRTFLPTKAQIVGVGFDPIAGDIPTLQFGSYALRVNDSDPNYHVTSVSQRATVPATGSPQIRFKWAAVLEDPQHTAADQPYVDVVVRNITDGIELYRRRFYTNDPSFGGWRAYRSGTWKAIPWQTVVLTGLSGYAGDTIELQVIGADCGLGGHGGYVYLDGEE